MKFIVAIFLFCIMMLMTSCQTSSITVIDSETREPVADAMAFAYCHEYVGVLIATCNSNISLHSLFLTLIKRPQITRNPNPAQS